MILHRPIPSLANLYRLVVRGRWLPLAWRLVVLEFTRQPVKLLLGSQATDDLGNT